MIFLVGRAVGIFNFGATSAQVTVENVTGKSAAEAQKILEDLGLKVKFAYETSDTVAEGNVISQDVQGGTTVSSGTQVQLTVSGTAPASDTDTIPVPDVLGALRFVVQKHPVVVLMELFHINTLVQQFRKRHRTE